MTITFYLLTYPAVPATAAALDLNPEPGGRVYHEWNPRSPEVANMLKKLSLLILGVVLVCTSHARAGSTGNGSMQRVTWSNAFCYAGNPMVTYFSRVITLTPKITLSNLQSSYTDYIKATYGLPTIDRWRCVGAASRAAAAAEEQQYKRMLGTTRLVETQWVGSTSDTH